MLSSAKILAVKLFFVLLFFPFICFGETGHWVDQNGNEVSDEEMADFMEEAVNNGLITMAKELQPVYENMRTCLPAESQYLRVLGKENGLCHFKYVDYDCFVPFDIAEEYANLGLKVVQEMMKGNISTESPENIRIQEILSNKDYCSYEMTWSVTMEDEDGNEVPVEGLVVE